MNQKYIHELLEKYWEAETSLNEEKVLQTYFESEEVPAEFAAFKPLFIAKTKSQSTKLSDNFESIFLANLEQNENVFKLETKEDTIVKSQHAEIKKLRWLAGIAASIALILSVYIVMPKDTFDGLAFNNENELSEAEHEAALKAYKQTKSALLFVSEKMNYGAMKAAEGLNKVPNLGETIQEIE